MISSHRYLSDNCFLFPSTLADAMRSMDMSRSLDSLILYPRFLYHVPPARVLVRFLSHFTCSLTCTNMDCRLISGYLSILCFSFCVVDSSPVTCSSPFPFWCLSTRLCLPLLLTLTCYVSSTRLATRYSWTLTRLRLIFLLSMFVLVSRRPLYIRLGMGTCSPSSIYFATTLKV